MSKKVIFASAFLLVFALAFGAVMVVNFSNVKSLVADSQIDFKTAPPVQTSNDLKGLK